MTALGELVTLQRGNTYKSALLGKPGPALLGLGSIERNGGFRGEKLQTYGGESDSRILIKAGELFVSLKDVTQSADLLGAVARVPDYVPEGRLTQDTVKLQAKSAAIDMTFLYWVLRSPQYRDFCRAHATGTTNLGLPREDFLSYDVPSFTTERKNIVQLLNALESQIELNRRMNKTLEAMAQAIFRDWFVDFGPVRRKQAGASGPVAIMGGLVQDAARAVELAALFPDGFGDDGLPVGWQHISLLNLADWINGAAYKNMHFVAKSEGLPVVKIAELKNGVTEQTKFTNTDLGEKYRICDGELLFSWSGNPDTSIDTFVWTNGEAWLNQHIFAVRENGMRAKSFLFAILKFFKPDFAELARNKQTTGLGHVTKEDMKRILVPDPPATIIASFTSIVAPIFERLTVALYENRTLAETRDYLLPKLMSGKVRVRDAAEHVGAQK